MYPSTIAELTNTNIKDLEKRRDTLNGLKGNLFELFREDLNTSHKRINKDSRITFCTNLLKGLQFNPKRKYNKSQGIVYRIYDEIVDEIFNVENISSNCSNVAQESLNEINSERERKNFTRKGDVYKMIIGLYKQEGTNPIDEGCGILSIFEYANNHKEVRGFGSQQPDKASRFDELQSYVITNITNSEIINILTPFFSQQSTKSNAEHLFSNFDELENKINKYKSSSYG